MRQHIQITALQALRHYLTQHGYHTELGLNEAAFTIYYKHVWKHQSVYDEIGCPRPGDWFLDTGNYLYIAPTSAHDQHNIYRIQLFNKYQILNESYININDPTCIEQIIELCTKYLNYKP